MNNSRVYFKIGISFAVLHAIIFSIVFITVISSEESQIQLLYIPFLVIDFPISLLYVVPVGELKSYVRSLGYPVISEIFYSPLLVNGILGTIWWYYVPKFFLPKRLGGVWGGKAIK